jgi:hypothetical protein
VGYTHYWDNVPRTHNPDTWTDFVNDVRKVLGMNPSQGRTEQQPVAGGLGEGAPEANIQHVWFNGKKPHHCETFCIMREGNRSFNFCKTRMEHYDMAVTAVLLLYKYYFPEVKISSDGDAQDWRAGEHLVRIRTGKVLEFKEE